MAYLCGKLLHYLLQQGGLMRKYDTSPIITSAALFYRNSNLLLRCFFLLLLVIRNVKAQFNVSSWYVGDHDAPSFPLEKIRWDIYTHIYNTGLVVDPDGSAHCNHSDPFTQKLITMAHQHNTKVLTGLGDFNIHQALWQPELYGSQTITFFSTIHTAIHDCDWDGIEVDYEWSDTKWGKLGIIPGKASTHYTEFLSKLKKTIGPNKTVSADISIQGIGKGEYWLGVLPWVNVTMLNRGDFDFINTMSYHWNKDGNIWSWKKDAWFIDQWGIDRKRVNIGIPYYSMNRTKDLKIYNEPTWGGLSQICPNIGLKENECDGVVFVGKDMNYRLGKWLREEGFGGVFPWAANYDSCWNNNSLVDWLYRGINKN